MNQNYYNEIAQQEKRKEAKRGEELFIMIMNKKNEKSEEYYYECLTPTNEYSPYDIQVQKHSNDDWGCPEITYHEIKVRSNNISYTKYDDSVIDLHKIRQLQKIASLSGKDVFVNMFYEADKTLLIWKIDPENTYDVTENNVRWNSVTIATGNEVRLNKQLVHLPNSEAIKIRY